MRRNFQPHESRGLSSVWHPNGEPQQSSDAPTRPISHGFGAMGGRPGGAYGPNMNAHPQSSFISVQADELYTDNVEPMHILAQESYVPAPSFNIPDARVASRYHMQRNNNSESSAKNPGLTPVEVALAQRYNNGANNAPPPLPADKLEQIQEIYASLRTVGIATPKTPSQRMQAPEIYAAVQRLFRFISPLPTDYEPTALGTLALLRLLGYPEEKLEIGAFALRMPQRDSALSVIVDLLSWLLQLVEATSDSMDQSFNSSEEPNDANHLIDVLAADTSMNFEKYIEFAEVSAFSLQAQSHGEGIPEEYFLEVKETLKSYNADTAHTIQNFKETLLMLNNEISELNNSVTGYTEDLTSCERLKRDLDALKERLVQISSDMTTKSKEVDLLQKHMSDLRIQRNKDTNEIDTFRSELVKHGILSIEEAVQLARSFIRLKSEQAKLEEECRLSREKLATEFERPARIQLTSLRLSLDEYNDGLDAATFLINARLPTDMDSMWGKTMASLLGEEYNGNVFVLIKNRWKERKDKNIQHLHTLEDAITSLETEIKSLEARSDSQRQHTETVNADNSRLQSDKEDTAELIANLEYELLTKKERIDQYKLKLDTLASSISSLELKNKHLSEEEARYKPEIESSIEHKCGYEMKLLEYQNAYSLLLQKITEIERAASGMAQAGMDTNLWISDLKPVGDIRVGENSINYSSSAKARALQLFNK